MKTTVSMLFAFCIVSIVGCATDTSPSTPSSTADSAEMQALLEDGAASETLEAGDANQGAASEALEAGDANQGAAFSTVWRIANCDGRLEQFRVSTSNAIEYRRQPSVGAAYGAWTSLGGQFRYGNLAVFRNSDCRIEVFGTGLSNAVFTRWQSVPGRDSWLGWASIGGFLISAPIWQTRNAVWGVCAFGRDNGKWCNMHTQPSASPWTGWFKA